MAHNFYQQHGGEDKCFFAESELLRVNGHDLSTYTLHNDAISYIGGIKAAGLAVWNRGAYNELSGLIRSKKPEIVHFHNTFPLMSPAALWAAKHHECAVVCTLHNYRLICPVGTLIRNGRICEDCTRRMIPWPGVVHGCYRDSRLASAAVASTLFIHRLLQTWSDKVDSFIVLTEFARGKFIEGGIPADKIFVKPNFVDPDPGPSEGGRDYALFVGRLSPEKGIDTLLTAWNKLAHKMTLRIVGAGPLSSQVMSASSQLEEVEFLGHKQTSEVMDLMAGAAFVVVPSIWYETFGLVIVEAFAKAKPVIASRLGAMTELVREGYTGLHFEPGNPDDLAAKVTWAVDHPREMRTMGQNARDVYVKNYGAERNYRRLVEIYQSALAAARGTRNSTHQ